MSERHDIWTLLDGLQMDARALNSKIVALRSRVAALNLAPADHEPVAMNHHAPYVPGGPLRYLEHVKALAKASDGELEIRVYLGGFTDDQAEIDAHLEALRVAHARANPAPGSA